MHFREAVNDTLEPSQELFGINYPEYDKRALLHLRWEAFFKHFEIPILIEVQQVFFKVIVDLFQTYEVFACFLLIFLGLPLLRIVLTGLIIWLLNHT